MKNIIIGAASFLIAILLIMVVYTVQGRETRNEEIQDGLSGAMTAAGEQMKETGAYGSDKAFAAAFTENLMQQMDSVSDVTVSILEADSEKGIISAEVTQTYQHPNGKEGKTSCMRTLVLDRENEELLQLKKSVIAVFYTEQDLEEDHLYKTQLLLEGEKINVPKDPKKDGYVFVEWRDAKTEERADLEAGAPKEDTYYYAVWREA